MGKLWSESTSEEIIKDLNSAYERFARGPYLGRAKTNRIVGLYFLIKHELTRKMKRFLIGIEIRRG